MNTDLGRLLDSVQDKLWLNIQLYSDPEPAAGAETSNTGSGQKFRLLVAPAPQHW
jgi:hypothetical protein